MASGFGSESRSVLVTIFGPTLSTPEAGPEDEQVKADPVSLYSNESNDGTDYTKSRLEAIFGPEFSSKSLDSKPGLFFFARNLTPTRPAGQDLSQIEQLLQDLTEKKVVSEEKFDAFRIEMNQNLGRIRNEIRCHYKFQMQVHQRVVPRIILCSEGKGTRQKILKTLARGVKSVRLHMLCELEGEEHKVQDAPGCELHLKEGENWEAIYPFLNHGLRVFDLAVSVAMQVLVGGNPVPPTHAWLQEFNTKIVQPNMTYDTSQTPQTAAAQAAASQGAEQWLVRHLKGRNMMQDFGLQRMVFEKPGGSQPEGTIAWLCKEHAANGKDSHLLANLPTAG